MFDGTGYRYMTAGDDLVAQEQLEGRRYAAPGRVIEFLIISGLLSMNQVRRFKAIWRATEAKARRRSGWGAP